MLDRAYPDLAFVTVGVELDPRWVRTVEQVQPEWPAVREEERPDDGSGGARRRVLEPFAGTRESVQLAPEPRRVSVALVLDATIAGDPVRRASIVAAVQKAVGPAAGRDPEVEVLVEDLVGRRPAAAPPVEVAHFEIGLGGWAALLALSALSVTLVRLRRAARARPAVAAPVAPVPEPAGVDLRREIEAVIGAEPDTVARVVEGWLAESGT
jgi:hypothetical protein